jgi:hypothetical protein
LIFFSEDKSGGADWDVEYNGSLSKDGKKIEGTWTVRTPGRPDFSGRFSMKKAPHDEE